MPERDTVTLQTRHGPMLAVAADRYITRSLATYGEFSPGEARLLGQIVKPGMTVVEVGANIGALSIGLARACAPGPLHLFEPQPRIFQILCANLALNDIGNAFAYPEAVAEADGAAYVARLNYAAPGNFGGVSVAGAAEPDALRVRATALDSLDLAACHLIKVDVEGFEAQVIRGARRTIGAFRPVLYVENDRPAQQQELISLIDGLGYRQYWHAPRLFDRDNFKGVAENVFGALASLNMLCLPQEQSTAVQGLQLIEPGNWTSPVKLD